MTYQRPPEDARDDAEKTRVMRWNLTHSSLLGAIILHVDGEELWRLYWAPERHGGGYWMPEADARQFLTDNHLIDIDKRV